MWTIEEAPGNETLHWTRIASAKRDVSFAQVCEGWRSDARFRTHWISSLRSISFGAYCWECPPVSESTQESAFECMFISSSSLARMGTDPDAFGEHFRPGCDVATFDNLGGDATLVAPCPEATGDFAHLASFTATASAERQDALWKAVGETLGTRIGPRPLWLSTAGHGVAWLHVRLDSRPKYYRHAPYMRI